MRIYYLLWALLFIMACQEDVLLIDEHAAEDHEEPVIAEPDENMDGEWVTYGDGFSGYFVKPVLEGKFPGIVMIHEWWGVNQNIKNMAHDMAQEGFVVLAVDLYDGKIADQAGDARKYSSEVRDNMDRGISHLKSAVDYLKNHEQSQGSVASMGWCFGGGMSMQLALNEEMDATVIYYGAVETEPSELEAISWPVLGVFGETDSVISVDTVYTFDSTLDELGIENEIYVYEGLGHAFANPSNPGHDKESSDDAWRRTIDFLDKHLKVN